MVRRVREDDDLEVLFRVLDERDVPFLTWGGWVFQRELFKGSLKMQSKPVLF